MMFVCLATLLCFVGACHCFRYSSLSQRLASHQSKRRYAAIEFRGSAEANSLQKSRNHYIQLDMSDDDDITSGSSQFSMEEIPLNQIFQKAVVLQRMGDRTGALQEYNHFLKVAETHDVDPSLYAEVYANTAAIYAMQGKGDNIDGKEMRARAKEAFQQALKYRPSLGSGWVNLALIQLAEGKEFGANEQDKVKSVLKEARSCCERALGLDNDDERSRSLANKLIGDIDTMLKQIK
ncbi:hypothetical protein ACHAWT_010407 [Skeletonema menzelii]